MFHVRIGTSIVGPYKTEADAAQVASGLTRGRWRAVVVYGREDVTPPVVPKSAPNPDAYEVRGYLPYFLVEDGTRVLKSGEEKPNLAPVVIHRIHVKCARSGASWYYTGMKRKGKRWYSDSRHKGAPSVSEEDMRRELTRMMGENKANEGMGGELMKMGDYKAIVGL